MLWGIYALRQHGVLCEVKLWWFVALVEEVGLSAVGDYTWETDVDFKSLLRSTWEFGVGSGSFHLGSQSHVNAINRSKLNFARRLQSIQNAAACFLTGAVRRRHLISPVLRSLHWLPVKQRVDYKLAILVYKSLRGQAPSYLVDDCQLIADSGRPELRSAHANVLIVPRTNTRLGDRSFLVAGPRIWNILPASLRQPEIEFEHFKRLLNKSFLFGETAAHFY